jgi:hypothetical protein
MRKRFLHHSPQRTSHLKRWQPIVALASIAGLLLGAANFGPSRLHAHQVKKTTHASTSRPVPGAGTTVDAAGLAKIIDNEIALRLAQEKIPASPRCDDSEFIRRAWLDLVGVIPPADKVKEFLDSKEPNKRENLISELLADTRFGKQQSEIWMHELVSNGVQKGALPTENLRKWLEDAFNNDKPWSKVVEELVTATGTVEENPPALFFAANKGVDKVTGQVSKLFMGVQLQCAQCHNHPFTDWKQDEYWGMAAFFMNVKSGAGKAVAKNGSAITISELVPVAFDKAKKKGPKGPQLPEGAKIVPPRFLTGEHPSIANGSPARPTLANWLTSPDNPYFAKAIVNRMWAHFFGRGLVNPIDDMHDANPASHPELLAALAEQLKRNDFSLKYLVKAITLSDAYQRTSRQFTGNEADTELFSRMYIKTLSPEQLVDSISSVISGPGKTDFFAKKGPPPPDKKGKAFPGTPRAQLINFFRVEDGADPLEYQDGIPQALRMMNGPAFNNGGNALAEAMKLNSSAEAVDYLYLVTLSRHPTVEENQRLAAFVEKQKDKRNAYGDIVWTLLNCSEFRLNH